MAKIPGRSARMTEVLFGAFVVTVILLGWSDNVEGAGKTVIKKRIVRSEDKFNPVEFYRNINSNLTRCASTRLKFTSESFLYTWEINGFGDYARLQSEFSETLELQTENVTFDSVHVEGRWSFSLSTNAGPSSETLIGVNFIPLGKSSRNVNYGVRLLISEDDRSDVTFSSTKPQSGPAPKRGSTVHFLWSRSPVEVGGDAAEGLKLPVISSGGGDLTLRFFIDAYSMDTPVLENQGRCESWRLPVSEDSNSVLVKRDLKPPYMRHASDMLFDEKYADMALQVGGQRVPAHRIILSNASPVLASLIYNETYFGSAKDGSTMPVIHVDDDIERKTVEGILQYVYTGVIDDVRGDSAKNLLVASDRYGLADLKRMMEKVMVGKVKAENSMEMYQLGLQVRSSRLTRRAFEVMTVAK